MQSAIAVVMMEAQSEHLASIDWQRGKWADAKGKYSRERTWWLVGEWTDPTNLSLAATSHTLRNSECEVNLLPG
jgi:hypothetical protein